MDGAHVALIDELARWPGPKLGSRASGNQMMVGMGQALVGTVTCTLRPLCIAASMYQSRTQRALVDAFRRALVNDRAAASRVGTVESLLSKLAGVLADVDHMRRNGTPRRRQVARGRRFPGSHIMMRTRLRGEVSEIHVEAR